MKSRTIVLAASTIFAVLVGVQPAQAEAKHEGAAFVEYFGYSGCIELKNENTRVILCPQGGRVLEYSWKGRELPLP